MSKIAIIGAGLGGLSAAYDLINAGHQVDIFETNDQLGGLASGFREPHWEWSVENYYHHWFNSDKHILDLMDELELREKVIYKRPYTVVYYKGKFYPFDSIPAAILFPGLGWGINKLRFGLVGLFLRLTNNWQALEKVTVDEWMRKWAGNRVYELMWEPLMLGKFGEKYAKQVSMAWMWARLKARTTKLGTFQGGFQAFADIFADKIRDLGGNFFLSHPINQLSHNAEEGLKITTTNKELFYERCLVTTSPQTLTNLVPGLPKEYLHGLSKMKHMGAVVLILSLKHQLSKEGYYWFNIPKKIGYPFLALVEHTNFVSSDHFAGEHIVYIGDYLEEDHEYFQLSKEEILQHFIPYLTNFNSEFSPDWINKTWLYRTKYAQPVPLLNHSKNIPAIQTPIPGLFFASMSQVYPWDRGTNFAVEIGRKAAKLIQDSI